MRASIPLSLRTIPVWLFAFFSPTLYFVLLLFASRFQLVPRLPVEVYLSLFLLIFTGALIFCVGASWKAGATLARKMGLTVFTTLGLLLQLGVVVFVLQAILIAMTSYAQ